jgi:hypothetical protein
LLLLATSSSVPPFTDTNSVIRSSYLMESHLFWIPRFSEK